MMAKQKKTVSIETIIEEGKALEAKIAKSKEPGSSNVSKASRGIDTSLKTTWVPFDADVQTQKTILLAAKVANMNVANYLAKFLKTATSDNWNEIQTLSDSYISSSSTSVDLENMTEEQLLAYIAREEKKIADLQAKTERLRAQISDK